MNFESNNARRGADGRKDLRATGRVSRGASGSAAEKGLEVIWLPDMDLNHDKQIQSLLCYRYTIGQSVGARG